MKLQAPKKCLILTIVIASILSFNVYLSMGLDTSSGLHKGDKFELNDKNQPIVINSDHLEGDNKKNVVKFTGNVVAKRGELTIRSKSISVMYDKANKKVMEIVAEGDVRINQGNKKARGEKAVFMNSQEKIILTGNPRVWEGDNIIKGEKITLFLAEDRGVVEGNKNTRVNATINIEKDEGEKRY
ncbi:MAG: lipopolysaccharide transport periplasmic protein LptA [Thermodesulfobacteriota bacterium]